MRDAALRYEDERGKRLSACEMEALFYVGATSVRGGLYIATEQTERFVVILSEELAKAGWLRI